MTTVRSGLFFMSAELLNLREAGKVNLSLVTRNVSNCEGGCEPSMMDSKNGRSPSFRVETWSLEGPKSIMFDSCGGGGKTNRMGKKGVEQVRT